jgi:catechol 2,3-dioxygenase-like lactoylglutathione lyase family enzyme
VNIKYGHTNIISENWQRLSSFYINVFDCIEVPPQRNLSGQWLEDGTGIKGAHLEGVHLRLPGFGEQGPTLEIFSYTRMEEKLTPLANRKGFGHIAFTVDNVDNIVKKVIQHKGSLLGKIAKSNIPGVGELTFVYCLDPEGNIIEIQSWKK